MNDTSEKAHKQPRRVPLLLALLTFFGMFVGALVPFFPILWSIGVTWANAVQLLLCFCLGLSFIFVDFARPVLGVKTPVGVALGILLLPLAIYGALLLCFLAFRRRISYAFLCVILGCVLFANVAGCRKVWNELGHSLSQNLREVGKTRAALPVTIPPAIEKKLKKSSGQSAPVSRSVSERV
jgi:hypothetical protein